MRIANHCQFASQLICFSTLEMTYDHHTFSHLLTLIILIASMLYMHCALQHPMTGIH